jgi:hypothetical protein
MPSRSRRLLILAAAGAAVVLAVGVWRLWPRTAITRENAVKIRDGMTLEEVEALLGGSARDESTGPLLADNPDAAWAEEAGELGVHVFEHRSLIRGSPVWKSDQIIFRVETNDDGRVCRCECLPVRRVREDLLDCLHRWLGL